MINWVKKPFGLKSTSGRQSTNIALGFGVSAEWALQMAYGDNGNYNDVSQGEGFQERARAIDFLNANQKAYYAGIEKWASGTINDQTYDNILLTNERNRYHKVYRKYTYGSNEGYFKAVASEPLAGPVRSHPGYTEVTSCNVAASVFAIEYGAPSLIQPVAGRNYGANQINTRLKNGDYNTATHEFAQVPWQSAVQHADNGGLSFASFKNNSGWGHIATLTGGYVNNQQTKNNIRIFQAGMSYGSMRLQDGFDIFTNRTDFFIWREKQR